VDFRAVGRLSVPYPDYGRVARHSPSIGLREEHHRPVATLQLVVDEHYVPADAVLFAIATVVAFAARFALFHGGATIHATVQYGSAMPVSGENFLQDARPDPTRSVLEPGS
jgi:hypothetical protein